MSASSLPQVFDITFIGAGPTGLFGAFYAGLREMTVKVIDVLPQPGGQLTALYPEKIIYDSPGLPAIASKELVVNLVRQMGRWHPTLALGERAAHLQRVPLPGGTPEETCWRIETDRAEHFSRTLVIAAGIGAFEPITLPNESVQRFVGHGVQYMVQDLEAFGGRRVLIIGGGDSAVDWALAIQPKAHSVTLIHRREGFRAHDASVDALQTSGVDVRVFHELRRLEGEARPERAVIYDNRTQEESTLPVDDVILALGFKADLGPLREWGLETIGRRYVRVNAKMETNLPGVYAAGDIALQEGVDSLNLIVIGYGQATVAANYAYTFVKPGGKVFPGHSSEKLSSSAAPGG